MTEEPDDRPPAIATEDLRKVYGEGSDSPVVAVDDVSLAVEPGTAVGLLGPNGAGKTTLMKAVTGLVTPTSGEARVNGVDVGANLREVYRNASILLEGSRNVYWRLTVEENMAFFASLQGIDPRTRRDEHQAYLETLNVADRADEPVRNLSRGMKQKASLACTLARDTPVVILDEPTLGLDVETSYELRAELRRLVDDEDRTVVVSSHDMDVVQDVCDRVVVFQGGRVVADDRVDNLLDLFRTQAVELGVDGDLSTADRTTLEREFGARDWTTDGSNDLEFEVVLTSPERVFDLMDELRRLGVTPVSITTVEPDLEEAFVRITEEADAERDLEGVQ